MKRISIFLILSAVAFLLSSFWMVGEIHQLKTAQRDFQKMHAQYKEDEYQLGEAYNQLSDLYFRCESYMESIDTIHRYSEEYNVDPRIILAVIRLESNFDSTETNGKYLGLMQIDEDNFSSRMEALDFEKNIECGASLLSLLQDESSDLNYIFNSYNMGRSGYQNYIERTGKLSREYSRKGISIIQNLEGEKQ